MEERGSSMKRFIQGGCVGVLLACVVSCGPRAGQDVASVIRAQQDRAAAGEVDKALSRLTRFFESPSYVQDREALLKGLLGIELGAGRIEAAEGRFEQVARQSPALAGTAVGLIEETLSSSGRTNELLAWHSRLIPFGFSEAVLVRLAGMHCRTLCAGGLADELPVQLTAYFPRLSPTGVALLVQEVLRQLIQEKRWGVAEQVLAKVESVVPDSPVRKMTVISGHVDLLLARDGYRGALPYLTTELKQAPDEVAARNVRIVGQATFSAGDLVAAETLFQTVLANLDGRGKLLEAAMEGWIRCASRRGSIPDLVARLEALRTHADLAPSFVAGQISDYYATVLARGNHDLYGRLFALCDQVSKLKLEPNDRSQIGGMMLDTSYYLEDFEMALKLVESGAAEIPAELKPQMIAKIHAHIEIKKGHPREAVGYLREFMVHVAKQDRTEIDPVNNCRVTTEMILGLNAKRIGDLLSQAGDAEAARAAYRESREHYTKALSGFPDPKGREHQKIVREMGAIPAG